MRILSALFWGVVVTMSLPLHAALAEKRVALVIGNSSYQHVTKLSNPANDAELVGKLLRTAGFDVVESRQDLRINDMKRVVRDFTDKTRDADIAVVYYAGHGIEVDGTNYLIPVDAELARDIDVEDETVSLDRIVKVLEPVRRLRLVILDACRDNPFSKTMKRAIGSRSIGRGLAKVEVQSSDTLIAFAAKAGSTASDGEGQNSPFATALINNLGTPGLDLRIAFGRVRDDVLKATGHKQEPFVYGSLGGNIVSLVPPRIEPVVAAPAPVDSQAGMRRDYELASQIGTREAWDQFLAVHSTGLYAGLARAARAKIEAEAARSSADAQATAARIEAQNKAALAKAQAEAEAKSAAARTEAMSKADAAAKAEIAKAQAEAKAAVAKSQAEAKAAAERAEAAAKAEAAARVEAAAKLEAANKALDAERAKIAQQVALATQSGTPEGPAAPTGSALVLEIKKELKRVGCYSGKIDDNWKSPETKQSLAKFAKVANLAKVPDEPDARFLNSVSSQITRVCPIECGKNEVESNGKCVAKAAPAAKTATRTSDSPTPAKASGGGAGGMADLFYRCKSGEASACSTICSAGGERACQKLGRMRTR
jgi:uncharacterized caspase-like protein